MTLRIRDLGITASMGLLLSVAVVLSWFEMPELRLWKSIDLVLVEAPPNVTLSGCFHLVVGLATFIPAFYDVLELVRVNQGVQAGKNRPLFLVTGGYYSEARHPMTARFIMIVFGFFVSLASVIGLLLIVLITLFFHAATLYEEKRWLLPTFGADYESFMKRVPRRYFSTARQWTLILIFAVALLGVAP